jgi:SET domain-containing protein
MADVFVAKSKIHGIGIFANRDIKKLEVINHDIENEHGLNHSCEANTVHIGTHRDSRDVAKRDIKKGEELTTNYINNTMIKGSIGFKCRCGSKRCLKKVPRI